MSAARAVMEARAAGIQLRVEDNDLLMEAAAPPSKAVLELLARHKPAIVAWLRPGTDGWSVEDWRAFYEERAGIIEFDGGLPRPEAEARAFECCVVEWMNRTFESSPPGRCLACGTTDAVHEPLLPFDTEARGPVWLHARCRPAWHQGRAAQAIAALAVLGIRKAGL